VLINHILVRKTNQITMAEKKVTHSTPFIEGEQINLCPPNMDNLNLYVKWMNSPNTRKYARYEFPQTIEEVKKLFEPKEESVKYQIFFEIWHKENKKPIGYTGLIRINWFNRHALIFYMIGEIEYWGNNLATEAGKLVINYAFNELNLHKISADVNTQNIASKRVAEKIGLKFEITRKNEVYIDGAYMDVLKYSLINNK
jgi:RimJ/RimL family protein N-acetyltransferase